MIQLYYFCSKYVELINIAQITLWEFLAHTAFNENMSINKKK